MKDPIVEEVRRIREELASRFDFDLKRICEHGRRRQHELGRKVVSFAPEEPPTTSRDDGKAR